MTRGFSRRGLGGGPRVRHPSISEAAKAIGVSQDTLRRWDRAGKLHTQRDARFGLEVDAQNPIRK